MPTLFHSQVPTPIPLPAFFLPAKAINTAAVIITVDLSKPWSVVESCCTWIQRVTHALNEQYHALDKRGSMLPSQIKVGATSEHDFRPGLGCVAALCTMYLNAGT